jgi:hypothetical protein
MRRRRSLILTVLILVAAVVLVAGLLGYLVKVEPDFYAAAGAGSGEDEAQAAAVMTRYGDLRNDIRSKPEWGAEFTAAELNAFVRANLSDEGWLADFLPENLHAPRVAIDGDRVKLAARYKYNGSDLLSTVLSIELRVWLVSAGNPPDREKLNTVAVEIRGVKAGALPVGPESMLDRIAEKARESNIKVDWYRHDGHTVGLFRFYADQTHPATQIRTVKVADGTITVAGRTIDPARAGE